MFKRSFTVRAFWDDDAKVYYSESDIVGLHIEAESLDQFEEIMMELAPEMIVANHIEKGETDNITPATLAGFIPAILWERPTNHAMA